MPTLHIVDSLLPSVGKKIAVAVTLVLLVVAGGFVFLANRTGGRMLEQQARQRALMLSVLTQAMIEHEMSEGKIDHARRALDEAVEASFVRGAFLLDNAGRVRYQVPDEEIPPSLDLLQFQSEEGAHGELHRTVMEGGLRYDYVLQPIRKNPHCFTCHPERKAFHGYVGVKFSADELRSVAADHRTTNALMALGGFLALGGMLYWLLSFLVIRPLNELHTHVASIRREVPRIQRGTPFRLGHLAESASRDEIAGLTREFNGLISQLNDANDRLLELHTERLEYAERLSSAGQMAASVAHEIRNPVAGVRGALEIIETEFSPGDERREIIGEMKVQLDRVNRAISDLLTYARPTPPLFGEVGVAELVSRTLGLFGQQLKGKGIELHRAVTLNGETVLADGKQIQQVLWNLLLNALQAMPDGGTLTVGAAAVDGAAEIRLTDTGTGIPGDVLGRVFEPFFTTKHKGTGLGMTISRRIVEQHGGSLALQSAPGAGTCVTIRLPMTGMENGTCVAKL